MEQERTSRGVYDNDDDIFCSRILIKGKHIFLLSALLRVLFCCSRWFSVLIPLTESQNQPVGIGKAAAKKG
jgi:hypothetical protein